VEAATLSLDAVDQRDQQHHRRRGERTYFEERVEYLPNFEQNEDYRVNGEAAVVAPLSRHLGLKLGYVVRFDNLPEPGVKKTDRFLTSGLQVSF